MAKLKGKPLEKRLGDFENWKENLNLRLDLIRGKINDLDFSPDSLKLIEEFLIQSYNDPMDALSLENSEIMDSIATYVGEVYIRNVPIELSWNVQIDPKNEYVGLFNFKYFIGSNGGFIGFNPFLNLVPNAISERTGIQILNNFNIKLNNLGAAIDIKKEISIIPQTNGFSYQHFIYFNTNSFQEKIFRKTLERFASKFKECIYTGYSDTRMTLTYRESYNFHFEIDKRPDSAIEFRETADLAKARGLELNDCNGRIEFWGDEDPNGEYINEYMFILEELTHDSIYIFDIRNGIFFDEF